MADFTFEIPAENQTGITKRIAEANKRAAKIGVPALVLTFGETYPYTSAKPGFDDEYNTTGRFAEGELVTEVTILGETPKFEGWAFLASLELGDNGAIIRSLPGVDCPADQRDRGNICDHCGHKRSRKYTFVVQHDDGPVKSIGRACMKDFMGNGRFNPEFIARWFAFVEGLIEDERNGGGCHPEPKRFPLDRVLCVTGAIISQHGWVSGAMARNEERESTASQVAFYLDPPPKRNNYTPSAAEIEFRAAVREDAASDERKVEVADAIEWILGKEPKNDYTHTLQVIAKDDWVDRKRMGFACSLLTAWRTEIGREIERAEKAAREAEEGKDSEYVGEIGKRQEMNLTVNQVVYLPSDFGVTSLHIMTDDQGNRIKWFASIDLGGDFSGKVKATIKAHSEYKGIRETIVNRVKAVA